MKYRFIMNMEYGYRLEVLKENGFVKETHNFGLDEMKENIDDICSLATETESEKIQLKNMLNLIYQNSDIKTMTFSLKGENV